MYGYDNSESNNIETKEKQIKIAPIKSISDVSTYGLPKGLCN